LDTGLIPLVPRDPADLPPAQGRGALLLALKIVQRLHSLWNGIRLLSNISNIGKSRLDCLKRDLSILLGDGAIDLNAPGVTGLEED